MPFKCNSTWWINRWSCSSNNSRLCKWAVRHLIWAHWLSRCSSCSKCSSTCTNRWASSRPLPRVKNNITTFLMKTCQTWHLQMVKKGRMWLPKDLKLRVAVQWIDRVLKTVWIKMQIHHNIVHIRCVTSNKWSNRLKTHVLVASVQISAAKTGNVPNIKNKLPVNTPSRFGCKPKSILYLKRSKRSQPENWQLVRKPSSSLRMYLYQSKKPRNHKLEKKLQTMAIGRTIKPMTTKVTIQILIINSQAWVALEPMDLKTR